MTMQSMTSYGYADDLFGFPRLPAEVREASRFPIKTGCENSLHVPEVDPAYVFRKDHLKVLQFWSTGAEKNLLLQGETGTGKTSLVEQFAARINCPVFALGCHGGLEFQELVGRVTITPDGSTGWSDGPLIAAMRAGGIFLLDEMNFLKPEVAGGLNTILQATCYTIPETGEVVKAHPDFRVAATGNAIDGVGKSAYRGTNASNIALLSRFTLGIRVNYMSVADEKRMLQAKAPDVHEKVANYLAELAQMSRLSYKEGTIKSPLSPRETISSARRISAFSGNLKGEEALQAQCQAAFTAFEMTFMFRWSPEDQSEFAKASGQLAARLGLPIVAPVA